MTDDADQPDLWGSEELSHLKDRLEQAREQWRLVRRRHAVGSVEEEAAWNAYRTASDRLWALLHTPP